MLKVRRGIDQRIKTGGKIRDALIVVNVFRRGHTLADQARYTTRAINELAGTRNHRHRRQHIFQRVWIVFFEALFNLERQLRNAIAEFLERHVFKDDISEPTKGRCGIRAFRCLDQRIGVLGFTSRIDPRVEFRQIQRLAVGPDPANAVNFALAEPNCKGYGI